MRYVWNKNERGFTVVETLVSLFIFSASVVVLIIITASGIHNTNLAKNRLTANYLAQEGVELVRNIRDTAMRYNNSSATGWEVFKDALTFGGCFDEDGCMIEPLADLPVTNLNLVDAIESCNPPSSRSTGCRTLERTADGFMSTTVGTDETTFAREVKTTQLPDGEIAITVNVYWMQGQEERSVSVNYYLYQWIAPVSV